MAFTGLSKRDCHELSLGELDWLSKAVERRERLWDVRFARLMALLANLHRDQHRRPYTALDFMPEGSSSPARPMTPEEMVAMIAPLSIDKRTE